MFDSGLKKCLRNVFYYVKLSLINSIFKWNAVSLRSGVLATVKSGLFKYSS
jgi:hypothetical protein